MILRPYQKEAVKAVFEAMKETHKQVLVLATGTGKTIIFSEIISRLVKSTGKKALVLAHREELLRQAKKKLKLADSGLKVGIEQGSNHAGQSDNVILASVATIGRAQSKRIQKFNPQDFCIIVVDEAHHSTGETYKNILRHFGVLKEENDTNKDILLLGVTATPSRNDNEGIDKIFDKVVFEYHIIKAIKEGHLCRIRAFRVDTQTSLMGVSKVAGDFNQGELSEAVNNPARNKLVADVYDEKLAGKQALVFCVDVKHTQDLTQEFSKRGIPAAFITGTTHTEIRKKTAHNFSDKRLKVLLNCMTLTEGVDIPSIDAILLARPTQSSILFQQMVGRGTRNHQDKEFMTVVDFVDLTNRRRLQTTASLLGLQNAIDFQGKDILDVKPDIDKLIEVNPFFDLDSLDISNIKYALSRVDIFSALAAPEEIKNLTSFAWFKFREDYYRLTLPEKQTLHIYRDLTNNFIILDEQYLEIVKASSQSPVWICHDIAEAFRHADDYLRRRYPQFVNLVDKNSSWRGLPPKPSQLIYLQKMGINEAQASKLNRGEASQLLSKLFSMKPKQRGEFISGI